MGSAILAVLFGAFAVAVMRYESHYKRTHGLQNAENDATLQPGTTFAPAGQPSTGV